MTDENRAILVVDDDPNDALFIQRAIELSGWSGETPVVENGEEAVAFLEKRQTPVDGLGKRLPWLILTDLKMPRMDGFEFLRWLRTQSALAGVPIVVLTSSNHDDDVDQAFRLGARGFMVKPVGFDELERMMRSIVNYWDLSLAPGRHRPG